MKYRRIRSQLPGAILAAALIAAMAVISVSAERLPVGDTPAAGTSSSNATEAAKQVSAAFENAAARVTPWVVPIISEQQTQERSQARIPPELGRYFGDDFFRHFFPPEGEDDRAVRGFGSGVVVSADGYVLTNAHVVRHAERVTVVLPDKKRHRAEVVGTDPQTDLAVIKIDAHGLEPARLGDSDAVKVGQWVLAVGNPFQLLNTVTTGIVSATGRASIGLASYESFIQTDASINPGNSGGALADLDGNVIGINTAISSPSGGNVGIGFAIPINMAKDVMHQLIDNGKVTRGYLGLVPQDLDDDLARALRLNTTSGSLVGDVTPDGPASEAGVERGDVITTFDGRPVDDSNELRNLVAAARPGAEVEIELLRDGKRKAVTVRLGTRPGEVAAASTSSPPHEQATVKLGLAVQPLTDDLADELGYAGQQGVLVAEVIPGTPAADTALRRGDLLKRINRTEIRDVDDVRAATAELNDGDHVALLVQRGETTFFVGLQLTA